jgi:hypothetical protein
VALLSTKWLQLSVGAALAWSASACSAQVEARHAQPPIASAFGSDRAADLCAGLSLLDRERPVFLRHERIQSVRALDAERSSARLLENEVRGAEILVRSDPALTRSVVARALVCHLTDPVALALAEPFEDPLLVGTPRVSLESSQDGLVIRIAGHDGVQGEEILRRAEGLQRN